jgi:hypothetical protein
MPKKPKIKHSYDHDKDRMKISIRGYSLSKITRDEILENLIMQIERSPDRLPKTSKDAGKKSAIGSGKKVLKVVKERA